MIRFIGLHSNYPAVGMFISIEVKRAFSERFVFINSGIEIFEFFKPPGSNPKMIKIVLKALWKNFPINTLGQFSR